MKKLPRGIIRLRTCSRCPDRESVEIKRGKRTVTVCALDEECPDKKKYSQDYYIRYKVDGKDIKEKVGPSILMAKKALASRRGEVAQGKFKLEDVQPGVTFREFAQNDYLEHSKQHKRSWKRDALSIKHFVAHLGDMHLRQITSWHVEKYKNKRRKQTNPVTGKPIAPATVSRELACLKNMFNLAIQWGYMEKNPVRGVKFFHVDQKERYLTEEEINRLIESCSGKLKAIVIMALFTGMRLNEILKLQWKNINFDKGIITIEGVDSKNREPRYIPLNSVLTDVLREIKIKGSIYVFPSPHGGHLRSIRSTFDRALARAGIENCTFHTLRHTFASHLVMRGADLLTVQKLGGWKSLSMVQRYAHLSQEHERKAVEELESILKVENKWTAEDTSKASTL